MIEDVYAVPVIDRFILCSPRRGLSALVNAGGVEALARAAQGSDLAGPAELAMFARALLAPAPSPPVPCNGPIRPCFLGIVPTRACNGACTYCGFGAADAPTGTMDSRLAVAAVDWMAENVRATQRDVLEVHFFGGEPFLARDVVTCVVERTRMEAARLGVAPHLEASTNGVHDEALMRWAGDHFDAIVLSLDGRAEIHDVHRPLSGGGGSHAAAMRTARILGSSRADLCLRACISSRSVDRMSETASYFLTELEPSVVNLEPVREAEPARANGVAAPEPFAFARGFARAHEILGRAGVEVVYAGAGAGTVRFTACPVGRDAVILSADGTLSGCYLLPERWERRGLDLRIGRAGNEAGVVVDPIAIEGLRALVLDKPRCGHCFCRWTCAGGCHVDDTYPGCRDDYTGHCAQTRVITAWQLLENMGCAGLAQALLAGTAAMEALAYRSSDRLEDWQGS
jgi:uncharacterized protein